MPEPGDLAPEGAILPSRERAIISRPLRRELVGRNRRAGMRVPWGRVDLEYDVVLSVRRVRSASSQFGILALDCNTRIPPFDRSIACSFTSFVCCPGRVAVHMWMRLQRRKYTTPRASSSQPCMRRTRQRKVRCYSMQSETEGWRAKGNTVRGVRYRNVKGKGSLAQDD